MTTTTTCPCCGATDEQGAISCATCGFDLTCPEASRLQQISEEYWALAGEQARIGARLRQLLDERAALLAVAMAGAGSQLRQPAPAGPEAAAPVAAAGSRLRAAVAFLGAVLVVAGALGFAGFEWSHLGAGGRLVLLAATTAAVLGVALALARRLPTTASALAVAAELLVLVDWGLAGSITGASASAPHLWWAGGLALAGVVGVGCRPARLSAPVLTGAAALAGALPVALAPTLSSPSGGVTLAGALGWPALACLLVVAAVASRRRPSWRPASTGIAGAALLVYAVAVVRAANGALSAVALRSNRPVEATALTALAVVPLAASAAARRWGARPSTRLADGLDGAVTLPAIGAVVVAASAGLVGRDLPDAALAAGLLAVGAVAATSRRHRTGVTVAAAAAGFVGAVSAVVLAAASLIASWSPLRHPWHGRLGERASAAAGAAGSWSHSALGSTRNCQLALVGVVLLTGFVAVVAGALTRAERSEPRDETKAPVALCQPAVAVTVGLGAVASSQLLAFATSISLGGEVAVVLFLAAVVAGLGALPAVRRRLAGGQVATVLIAAGVAAVGWVAASAPSSLAAVALATGISVTAAIDRRRSGAVRSVARALVVAGTEGFVVLLGVDLSWPGRTVALAACATAALGLAAGRALATDDRPLPMEAVALAGLGLPSLWSWLSGDPAGLAADLGLAELGLALAAVVAAKRLMGRAARIALGTGLVVAVPLTWALLAAAQVHLVEAYSLTLAAALSGAALLAARWSPAVRSTSSWWRWGPALVTAFVPSTVLCVVDGGLVRPALVAAGGLVAVVAGARAGEKAPLALGGLVLVILGIDGSETYLGQGPRFVTIGVAGVLLLVAAAVLERHRAEDTPLGRCRNRFRALR